jgi:RNase P/RNase MRP subunit POP5
MVKRTRFRYIVLRISGAEMNRGGVINSLNDLLDRDVDNSERLWLVHFENNIGVVRCSHTMKERVIDLLNGIRSISGKEVQVETIGTTGTIKSAMSKYVSVLSRRNE